MTAMVCANSNSFNCCCTAVCSSAARIPVLDTAILLVVSICVLCLRSIRIWNAEA